MDNLLSEVKDYLEKEVFELSKATADGRVNSSLNELQITNLIKNKFTDRVYIPSARKWYDMTFDGQPVNIKVTGGKSADNACNTMALRYAFSQEDSEKLLKSHTNRTKDWPAIKQLINDYKNN